MPEFICRTCGNRVQDEHQCPACNAIMAVEHTPNPSGIHPGKPPIERERAPDEAMPSIRREYHHSFVRTFLSFFAIWLVVVAIFVFFAMWGR